jgi:hypothetical protein
MSAVTKAASPQAPGTLARPRNAILVGLLVLSAIGWALVVWQAGSDSSMSMRGGTAGSMGSSMETGLDLTMGLPRRCSSACGWR